MTNWRLMVGIFALPQFISLFLFAWMLSSSQSGPLCMPQTYSKILFICLISLSPLLVLPLCFSVHVLGIIHTLIFLFKRFYSSIHRPHIFFYSISVLFVVVIQLYVYSFQIILHANTGILMNCVFLVCLRQKFMYYVFIFHISLLISKEPVQIMM